MRRILPVLVICVMPATAAAQPWLDAIHRGDYAKAADILHTIVGSADPGQHADAAPMRHLATLYSFGLGVPADPIVACTLAMMVERTTNSQPQFPRPEEDLYAYLSRDELRRDENTRFRRAHCGQLSADDQGAALRSMACLAFGMPEETLSIGAFSVRLGRRDVTLISDDGESAQPIVMCPQLVARIRVLTATPPADAAPGVHPRHFLEMLGWERRGLAGSFILQWHLLEVRDSTLAMTAMADAQTVAGWPERALPPEFDGAVTLEMIRSGHVRWRLDGAPPQRGLMMLQGDLVYAQKDALSRLTTNDCTRTRPLAEAAEDLQYLATLGQTPPTRRVFGRVTESRRDPAEQVFVDYGPLEGVTVNLRGADFSRDAGTDAHGHYEFTDLPPGSMTVSLLAPHGVDRRGLASEFELHHERGCQQRDFVVTPIAGASGTLLDAAGQPVAGVDVDAVAAELAGFAPPPYNRPARTDERGQFRFEQLPPGTYVFGLNLTRHDRPAGPPSPLTTSLELAAGEHKELGTIRLAAR